MFKVKHFYDWVKLLDSQKWCYNLGKRKASKPNFGLYGL